MRQALFVLLLLLCSGCSLLTNLFDNRERPELERVLVKGGTFTMGDVVEGENSDALPTHEVTIDDFYLTRYEITYEQYDLFADETDRERPQNDGPSRGKAAVVYVDWFEAEAFCNYVGMRLPTEQEWEYAAREGGKRQLYPGTNSVDSLDRYARFEANTSANHTFPVGTKKPNALGLYDMAGNAFEWIGGYYQFYPKPGEEPNWTDLEQSGIRIIRGGSFMSGGGKRGGPISVMKTHWRVGTLADVEDDDLGFRCAADAENR